MYIKYIALAVLLSITMSTVAHAQMYSDIKSPTESLYEITKPSNKVLKVIADDVENIVTQRLKEPDVGLGKDELAYFKTDIKNIYSEMNKELFNFWSKNKKQITKIYADNLSPKELIVYNKYLSTPESKIIEKKRPVIKQELNKLLQDWISKKLDAKVEIITKKVIDHQLNTN